MAATTVQSRTANIVVPSIHLGSFSPYPKMSTDLKHSIRFPENNTVPVFREESPTAYQPRTPSQWRPNPVSYPPNQSYSYSPFPANRSPYTSTTTMPRTPPPPRTPTPSGLYANVLQGSSPGVPIQPPNSPAQLAGPPRDVCVECMMRDEDMADVDVTSPGVWERESDIYYHQLCAREEEEEREKELNGLRSSSSVTSSSTSEQRPRAKGGNLTEGNLKVWLSLNPREPAAKQQTLRQYLDSQNALLVAESRARMKAMQESRQLDDKMRDAYSQLRRSAYDLGASASALDDGGVRIRSPSMDDMKHKRDTVLLENGMIVERVDMRKEESRLRKEERRARKASRDSLSVADNRDRERDVASLYSFQAAEGPASSRTPAPNESSMSVPMPASRSVRSMYTTPSTSWQQQLPNRPMSMAPASGSAPGFSSQTSLDSGSPRRRFFGMKQWSGYFSSNTSLAPSGSMVDMHIGLEQDKHLAQIPHVDIGSNAPSLREAWPRMEDGGSNPDRLASDRASPEQKKKRRGLGRLWKIITGAPGKAHEHQRSERDIPAEVEEEDLPLAPPPPLSYLVNRSSAQPERPMSTGGSGRHLSMPSLTSLNAQHPRSSSTPNGVGLSVSSPSEKSSTLPSPTEVRFPYRDSSGDEPEEDDSPGDASVKKAGGSPTRHLISKISEPDFRRLSAYGLSPPASRNGPPSSSSLTPTIKVPPARPTSVMSFDKNLPPLPPGELELPSERPYMLQSTTLPFTAYPQRGLTAPNPGFRTEDAARRQSFSGLASRPALPRGARPGIGPMAHYDDFGASRHSLAGFEPPPIAKRRSRFGLSALLRRKERSSVEHHRRDASSQTVSSQTMSSQTISGQSITGLPREMSYDPYLSPPSMSEQSSTGSTRRPLDELVPQDPDFVAYRYPSQDERLDLSRG